MKVVSRANIVLINHPQNVVIIASILVLGHIQDFSCNKLGSILHRVLLKGNHIIT